MTLKEELLAELKTTVERQKRTVAAQRCLIGLLTAALALAAAALCR